MSKRNVRNDVHFDALGFFPDFMRRYKKRATRNEALDNAEGVCERLEQTGIRTIASMTFVEEVNDENRYISYGPWKRSIVGFPTRQYTFERYRRRFFEGYTAYCEILKRYHERPLQSLLLRHKYMTTLFGHNIQNIRTMSDPRFLTYADILANSMMEIEAKVFAPKYKSSLKIGNEWNHHEREFGSTKDEAAHFIADFHLDLYKTIDWAVPLHKLVIDISHSEHAKAWFSQLSNCPYCGRRYNLPEMLRNGKTIFLPEVHGFSIAENLDGRFTDFLYYASHNLRQKFSEDGGGGKNAKGYAVGVGPRAYRISDIPQTREFHLKLWTGAKDAGKQCVSGIFCLESLQRCADGEYRELWRKDIINWDRVDMAVEQHVKVYGE